MSCWWTSSIPRDTKRNSLGMNDAIASGFGGEKGDQILKATSALRPLWTLIPLPLSQVQPGPCKSTTRGVPKSLQHHCLSVISAQFHTYTPTSFEHLSQTLIQRIFHKIQHDRSYDICIENEVPVQPDQATIWAMSLLADPDSAEQSHTLALPIDVTLQHFVPRPTFANPIHPFTEIPTLYATIQPDTPFQLITSLHLDGVNDLVNDSNITSLKFATHLTVLRMSACRRVTDSGIRLLAASLELPGRIGGDGEGRGMWRLRAWYLTRCRGVSDKSMSMFARWPGLVLLDVRYTSCTTTGIAIFNRHTEAVFSNALARMQHCSNGLLELFGSAFPSSHLVNLLTQSLLQPDNGLPKRPIPYRSLNLIPSYAPLIPEYLPNPPSSTTSGQSRYQPTRTETTAYLSGGVGQLYGAGVGSMADEVREFRQDVATSLYMQALEEGLHEDPKPDKEDRWWEKKDKPKKKAKVYKAKPAATDGKGDKSKMFVAGSQGKQVVVDVDNHTQERREQMMVRVAQEGWERLTWSVGSGNAVVKVEVKVGKKTNLVNDIMTATSSSTSTRKSLSTPSSTRTSESTAKKPTPPGSNMFRPVAKAPGAAFPVSKPSVPASIFASAPKRPSTNGNPFSMPNQRTSHAFGVQPLSSSPAEPSSSVESEGFGVPGKKRSWGGVADEGAKRRGMKMFSGARM